jgi:hypothetical protein
VLFRAGLVPRFLHFLRRVVALHQAAVGRDDSV